MKCKNCGEEVADYYAFCTKCGSPMERTEDGQEPSGSDQTGRGSAGNKKLMIALIVLAGIAVILLLLLLIKSITQNKPSETAAPTVQTAPAQTNPPETETKPTAPPTTAPTTPPTTAPTAAPTTEPPPETTAAPTEPIEALDAAIDDYLNGFILDTNNAEYWHLYSSVESGSPMEKEQIAFMKQSGEKDRYEELLDYQILSHEKISDKIYHVTVLESYEIWQNDEMGHFAIKQRCVYRLNRQSDGTWKLYGFEDSESFDLVKY